MFRTYVDEEWFYVFLHERKHTIINSDRLLWKSNYILEIHTIFDFALENKHDMYDIC